MITETLPCRREDALSLLDDAISWLGSRARATLAIGGVVVLASLAMGLLGPVELRFMGLASAVLVLAIAWWLYRGNRRLLAQVQDFRAALASGTINLEDYCDIALVTAVVAYHLKRTGSVAPGRGAGRR